MFKNILMMLVFVPCVSLAASGTSVVNDSTNESVINQSPTMALGGSSTSAILEDFPEMSAAITIKNPDNSATSISNRCPTNAWVFSVSGGKNNIETRPTYAESEGTNVAGIVSYVMPTGQAVDDCYSNNKVINRMTEMQYSRFMVDTCFAMAKVGVDFNQVSSELSDQFKICPRILKEGIEGFHGHMRKKIAQKYLTKLEDLQNKNKELQRENNKLKLTGTTGEVNFYK